MNRYERHLKATGKEPTSRIGLVIPFKDALPGEWLYHREWYTSFMRNSRPLVNSYDFVLTAPDSGREIHWTQVLETDPKWHVTIVEDPRNV